MTAKQVTLPVTGMTCANCSLTVERNLKRLGGVEVATVNLATERASVTFDPALVGEGEFLALIRDIGYDVPTAKAELPITGMTCANCAQTIERTLGRLKGWCLPRRTWPPSGPAWNICRASSAWQRSGRPSGT